MLGRRHMVMQTMARRSVDIQKLLFSYLVGQMNEAAFLLALERLVLSQCEWELDRIESQTDTTESP